MTADVAIRRYTDVAKSQKLIDEIDAIFFQSSNTQFFESDASRSAFRERWLGRYLKHEPRFAYLALTEAGDVAGYLAGRIEAPGAAAPFSDAASFAGFGDLVERYPAHLHVNVAAAFRNRGIGGRLIGAFVEDARHAGARGVHVVTGAQSRNVAFYLRNGFVEIEREERSRPIVFLGRVI